MIIFYLKKTISVFGVLDNGSLLLSIYNHSLVDK